jgi:hypothetical protein
LFCRSSAALPQHSVRIIRGELLEDRNALAMNPSPDAALPQLDIADPQVVDAVVVTSRSFGCTRARQDVARPLGRLQRRLLSPCKLA